MGKASMKSVVLFSGGQDSTICLFEAVRRAESAADVLALSINYGQRHSTELDAAATIARRVGCPHEVITLPAGILSGSSPLVNDNVSLDGYADYADMVARVGDAVEATFVPARNALFMTLAANRAAVAGAPFIFTGICQEDTANYPDCTEVFRDAMEAALCAALGSKSIIIEAPLMWKTKAQGIRYALTLPGCYHALAYSHTSYDGKFPPTGNNHANILRARGFAEAGLPDPLVCRAWFTARMRLPDGGNYAVVRETFGGLPDGFLTPDEFIRRVGDAVGARA